MRAHRLHGLLSSYLDDIRGHLKPHIKVTLVVRDPTDPSGDCDTALGNDEWDEMIAAVERLRAKEQTT